MKEELPQKIGTLSGTIAFFLTLFVSPSYGADLFGALLYAVYSFFLLLILGWAVGTAIVYQKEEEEQSLLEPNPNETDTDVATSEDTKYADSIQSDAEINPKDDLSDEAK